MLNYTPQNQLDIFNFKTEFESKLDPNNRWVKLAKLLDWDSFANIYSATFSTNMGAKSVDARVVIGALIIKHLERKDDRGTIEIIKENPYMQYFLGFDCFHFDAVFDATLFVAIRKRLGNESFDKMNQIIIKQAAAATVAMEIEEKQQLSPKKEEIEGESLEKAQNIGKLQMDATVCDANIKFPTDLGLLNDSREKSEEIIDTLCKALGLKKPRTYRQEARKNWLNLSKSKKNTKKKIRNGLKQQLNYLRRNLKNIDKIVAQNPKSLSHLSKIQYRYLLVISELYRQQAEMYQDNKHSISNRIVSIHQPHIRPIVRGKAGKNTEFGAKINLSLDNGYARIDYLSFEAFNEGTGLIEQVENYKKLHGYYPELVQVDAIYLNKKNRSYLKDNKIRHIGKPLGRKPKEEISKDKKAKIRQETNERNHIEGKFGQAKSTYGLNKIMAKLTATSQSWIAAIMFVINILKLSKDILCLIFDTFNKTNYRIYLFETKSQYHCRTQ